MQIARSCADERRDFRVDHDISCETQLFELVSLNSVVHLVSSSLRVYPAFSLCVVLLTTVQPGSTCAPATDCDLERV